MKTGNRTVDRNLDRVRSKWRGLLFLERTGRIGSLASGAFLLLGLTILAGWVADPTVASFIIIMLVLFGGLAWFGAGLMALAAEPDSSLLAQTLERSQPALLDRVHALAAMRPARGKREGAFHSRIARQAQQILARRPPPVALSGQRAAGSMLTFVFLFAVTIGFYVTFTPWQRMLAARKPAAAAQTPAPTAAHPDTTLELAALTNALSPKPAWGEVRITDPGRDLQLTKVDVVPLQIEAAANDPLQQVAWATAINGHAETTRDLPAPREPRFAVYQPVLYLDELKLADWDVLSYYAWAKAGVSNTYASEVYFIEIRPFREDILKLPGGEEGEAMRRLLELSALIRQQQHVIRQTHQHAQQPPDSPKQQTQDRAKLADAEQDLAASSRHLYASMAATLENQSIGPALDHLALAEKELDSAAGSLTNNLLPQSQQQERGALADLVSARKAFQKAVTDHPEQFRPKDPESEPPAEQLKELAEFRDEARVAQTSLRKLIDRQRELGDQVRAANTPARSQYPALGERERQIQRDLARLEQQLPDAFKPASAECQAAGKSLKAAGDSLDRKEVDSDKRVREGGEKLQQLAQSLKDKADEKSLAQVYKLKQMLDRQIDKLGECQNPGADGGPSAAEVKQTIATTRQVLKGLQGAAEQSPTREAFGPELRDAVSSSHLMSVNWPLGELEQASSADARKKPAGEAKQALEKISQAFERSMPKTLRLAQKPSEGNEPGQFDRGVAQLESLLRQLEAQRPVSPNDRRRQGQEALYNLQTALPDKDGSNEHGAQILARLEQELKKTDRPVDIDVLRSTLEALRAFSVEMAGKRTNSLTSPQMTGIDPNRLPPAYRERIQKYFQKLSEK
jgi:hypothetical protein